MSPGESIKAYPLSAIGSTRNPNTPATIIIGAGLAGISTGFALAEKGVSVVIVDAAGAPAEGASHANAGMITPSMSDPWNAPGVFAQVAAGLIGGRSPLKLNFGGLLQGWRWAGSFLLNANEAKFKQTVLDNYALSAYSQEKLRALVKRLNLSFSQSSCGTLKVFRDAKSLISATALAELLADKGLVYQYLEASDAAALEPVLLQSKETLCGALHFPVDDVGDAREFTIALSEEFRRLGGEMRFNTQVQNIVTENNKVTGVRTANELMPARNVVVAAGSASASVLRDCGVRVLIAPVKGYSLTIDGSDVLLPKAPIVDMSLHTVVTAIGKKLRVSGIAEVSGQNTSLRQDRLRDLQKAFDVLYPNKPDLLDLDQAEQWAGLRPMSADGLPYIGASDVAGLYVNTGHGHLGWTMAVGSADLLCAKIIGAESELDMTPFALDRA